MRPWLIVAPCFCYVISVVQFILEGLLGNDVGGIYPRRIRKVKMMDFYHPGRAAGLDSLNWFCLCVFNNRTRRRCVDQMPDTLMSSPIGCCGFSALQSDHHDLYWGGNLLLPQILRV